MIKLNTNAVALIRGDRGLKSKIIGKLGCSERTLYTYLDNRDENLTKLGVIDVLVEHTNLPLSELIEGGKVSKLLAR